MVCGSSEGLVNALKTRVSGVHKSQRAVNLAHLKLRV